MTKLPIRTNKKPEAHYHAPPNMPELHLCFMDGDEGDDEEFIAALNDPRIRAGEGHIRLSCEWYVGYLWFDGKRWQSRTWQHYSPSEDEYRNPAEIWRDLRHGAPPEALND